VILSTAALVLILSTAIYLVVALRSEKHNAPVLFPSAASKKAQRITGIISAIVVLAFTLWFFVSIEQAKRRPSHYLIPDGYVGWVRIEVEVPNASPVPIEEGHYIFKIPKSGLLQTSTSLEYGWARDQYFYYSDTGLTELNHTGWGKGGRIWGAVTGSGTDQAGVSSKYEQFFVGTEEQFKVHAKEEVIGSVEPIR
jgi:hypothetical protein